VRCRRILRRSGFSAVTGEAAATSRMARTEIKPCLKPGFLGNVSLAGERRDVTQLHRPRSRTPSTWRARLTSLKTVQSLPFHIRRVKQRACGADDDPSHSPAPNPHLRIRRLPTSFSVEIVRQESHRGSRISVRANRRGRNPLRSARGHRRRCARYRRYSQRGGEPGGESRGRGLGPQLLHRARLPEAACLLL